MIWPEERLWLPKRPFMKDCLMMGADTAACEGGRFFNHLLLFETRQELRRLRAQSASQQRACSWQRAQHTCLDRSKSVSMMCPVAWRRMFSGLRSR